MSILNHRSAEILMLLFFIITYLISVLEKLSNWKETVLYYTAHFKKTVLSKFVPLLLINVIIFEIVTLIFISLGLYTMLKNDTTTIATIGLEISAITLLQFLFAQRLAKDYQGAMNITVYFILNIIGIYILT